MLSPENISIFVISSHEDDDLKKKLLEQIVPLERNGLVEKIYSNESIEAGSDWAQDTKDNLRKSDIVLLLVSSSFIASEQCYSNEMQEALSLHNQGEVRTIPIILRKCLWEETPFSKLKAMPKDGRTPVVSQEWESEDEPYFEIVKGIKELILDLKHIKNTNNQVIKDRIDNDIVIKPHIEKPTDQIPPVVCPLPPEEHKTKGFSIKIFGIPIFQFSTFVIIAFFGVPIVLKFVTAKSPINDGTTESNQVRSRKVIFDQINPAEAIDSLREFVEKEQHVSFFKDSKSGKFGLLGKMMHDTVAPPIYQAKEEFENGLAPVKLNGLWGIINEHGEDIIEPIFNKIPDWKSDTIKGVANKKILKYNRSGKAIEN